MKYSTKRFITLSIWCASIIFAFRLILSWQELNVMITCTKIFELGYSIFGFIGESITVAAFLMFVFNKWAWKWKLIRLLHSVPILYNRYSGTFVSDYDHKERNGELIINQTFLNISVVFNTAESSSRSITATIDNCDDLQRLIYTYQNEPKGEIQDRSPIHYGTAILDVTKPNEIGGNYYTGRKSRGSMTFTCKM